MIGLFFLECAVFFSAYWILFNCGSIAFYRALAPISSEELCNYDSGANLLYIALQRLRMLKGENIIYFGNDWNADNKTSSHHVAEHLARRNRLLYVESPGLRRPRGSSRDLKRIWQKISLWLGGPRQIHDNLYVVTLFLLPLHGNMIVRRINEVLIIRTLVHAASNLDFNDPILWILLPHMELVIGKMKEKLVVHYCHDNYEAMPGVDSSSIAQIERRLVQRSDIIFAVNELLLSKSKAINRNVYLSPHGVDIKHFSKALDWTLQIPQDIANIPRPIIGFFGLIEEWIDQNLISFLAKSRSLWSFVFIGRAAVNVERISCFPNVYLLGKRDYADLPAYTKQFDVAIIPYVINEQTLNCNPLKLREYLAAGKPVVAVSIPEICKYNDVVQIAESYDEFLDKIEFSLENNNGDMIRKRIERVADESWDRRFDFVSDIVDEALRGKTCKRAE